MVIKEDDLVICDFGFHTILLLRIIHVGNNSTFRGTIVDSEFTWFDQEFIEDLSLTNSDILKVFGNVSFEDAVESHSYFI